MMSILLILFMMSILLILCRINIELIRICGSFPNFSATMAASVVIPSCAARKAKGVNQKFGQNLLVLVKNF